MTTGVRKDPDTAMLVAYAEDKLVDQSLIDWVGKRLEESEELNHKYLDLVGGGRRRESVSLSIDAASSIEDMSSEINRGRLNVPRNIGHYQIISVLGRGGMGLVYLAQQQQPKRVVALKLINARLTSLQQLRRLLREAEVLGRLQHLGIAQIYEAGTADSPDGSEPFIAMEYIRGQPITQYVWTKSLSVGARLDLFAKACDAIHHAHQQGIVHRDIKPANIMVDQSGQPKVVDFGVARLMDNDPRITRQTEDGQFIGTLAYMSPEHASAKPDQIDTRSDIYALGVVLYEMLAGQMPYRIDRCSIVDAVRVIREDDPARLSSISKRYSGDIEVIVNKALEKNKDKRYQSAAEMAADIRRHLYDQPILARAPSPGYQLQKFARRHKALVLGFTAVFFTLVVGLIGTTWQAVRATQQEAIAKQNAERASARLHAVLLAGNCSLIPGTAWKTFPALENAISSSPMPGDTAFSGQLVLFLQPNARTVTVFAIGWIEPLKLNQISTPTRWTISAQSRAIAEEELTNGLTVDLPLILQSSNTKIEMMARVGLKDWHVPVHTLNLQYRGIDIARLVIAESPKELHTTETDMIRAEHRVVPE
jgi:serine/threonine protein kinase